MDIVLQAKGFFTTGKKLHSHSTNFCRKDRRQRGTYSCRIDPWQFTAYSKHGYTPPEQCPTRQKNADYPWAMRFGVVWQVSQNATTSNCKEGTNANFKAGALPVEISGTHSVCGISRTTYLTSYWQNPPAWEKTWQSHNDSHCSSMWQLQSTISASPRCLITKWPTFQIVLTAIYSSKLFTGCCLHRANVS